MKKVWQTDRRTDRQKNVFLELFGRSLKSQTQKINATIVRLTKHNSLVHPDISWLETHVRV